jgi:hypothetical protein
MHTFGIISEGPTDQIIIENILVGYFDDEDLPTHVRYLQPLHDASDKVAPGGWTRVFEYCNSDYLAEALEQNDYLIIQIDTDCCEEKNYDVRRMKHTGEMLSPEELIKKVIEKFEALFINKFRDEYQLFKQKLLFAISVEEIECWLLPLYPDDKTKGLTNNCIHKLNPKITEKFGKYIDKKNKAVSLPYYGKFSRPFIKRKNIDAIYHDNISLKIFLNSLARIDTK